MSRLAVLGQADRLIAITALNICSPRQLRSRFGVYSAAARAWSPPSASRSGAARDTAHAQVHAQV